MASLPNSSDLKAGWDLTFNSTSSGVWCLSLSPRVTNLEAGIFGNFLDRPGPQIPNLKKKRCYVDEISKND